MCIIVLYMIVFYVLFFSRCTPSEGHTGASTVPTSCGVSSLRESSVQVNEHKHREEGLQCREWESCSFCHFDTAYLIYCSVLSERAVCAGTLCCAKQKERSLKNYRRFFMFILVYVLAVLSFSILFSYFLI